MDWYLGRVDHVADLRHEVVAYLSRHAAAGNEEAVWDAELVVAEAVGNAIRHTGGPVWVSLLWSSNHPVLQVFDLGEGFDSALLEPSRSSGAVPDTRVEPLEGHAPGEPDRPTPDAEPLAESGRGLLIMESLAEEVVAAKRAAGMVVSVRLAVPRRPTTQLAPPRRHHEALPALDEAQDHGGFGKESFLRALVVQLAQAVEYDHGPAAAEAAVAQVGTDVGGQMELEFRLAEEVVGRLSPEELGRCFVRLKHAIDGGFSVREATPDRIVLENTACPFGEVVLRAPALCRMTSSVFGGIAAANHPDGASVLLEERIAVGDPGCRIVVYLGSPPSDVEAFAHHYPPAPPAA
ncbi:ATP-binding protein [Oryzobacter sp. R7]|uniref:ATP-binding protein n=1 Tax=Oryzobacter faecalis TaxID=3388656 RepID=UPI00398D623F